MSFNTFGHMFRVTTFGESHGPAIGCVVDGCPPGIPLTEADIQPYLDKRRPGPVALHHPAAGAGPGADPLRRVQGRAHRRAGHHRHADRAADRQCRPALEGLFRHPRQVPARPRRLHLRREIRPARLSRRRPAVGARDRDAGRGRRDRAQDRARHDACAPRSIQMGPEKIDRARWDWDEVDRNPFFCPDAQKAKFFESYLDGIRKKRLVGRRGDRGGGRRRAAGSRRAGLRQARRRSRRRA